MSPTLEALLQEAPCLEGRGASPSPPPPWKNCFTKSVFLRA